MLFKYTRRAKNTQKLLAANANCAITVKRKYVFLSDDFKKDTLFYSRESSCLCLITKMKKSQENQFVKLLGYFFKNRPEKAAWL